MRSIVSGGVLALALMGAATFAQADMRDPEETACVSGAPTARIAACTTILARTVDEPASVRVNAFYNRALAFNLQNRSEEAVRDLDAGIRLMPDAPVVAPLLLQRAAFLHQDGKLEEALADADRAVQLDPSSAEAWTVRSMLRLGVGQVVPAIADLDEAVRLQPRDPGILSKRGFLRLRLRQLSEALSDYQAALAADASYARALNGRGTRIARIRGERRLIVGEGLGQLPKA